MTSASLLRVRARLAAASLSAALLLSVGTVQPAFAAVTVSRAELNGTALRLEGAATASRDITVDGVVLGRSDTSGQYRIQRDPYTRPADCTVDVDDGSARVAVARLSGCTATVSPAPDTVAPTVPGNLTATVSGRVATLTWSASTDAVGVTGYRVRRNGTAVAGTVAGTAFSDAGLVAGAYTYSVAAVDAAGNVSGASTSTSVTVTSTTPPSDTTAPTIPSNVTVTRNGTTADLGWTVSTDDVAVTGYRVTRNGVALLTVLNPFYNDTNLPVGTYTYSVAALDGAGNVSGSSSQVSVTVPPPPATDVTAPRVPTDLSATVVGTSISLGWGLSTDDTAVAGYRLIRNGTLRASTFDTSYLDTGLAPGTYTYAVAAFDAAGNVSARSAGVSATVAAATPLSFLTPAQMPDATLGQPYLGYIVSSDPPGPSTFRFRVVSGNVPPGTRFVGNTLPNRPEARVVGTPTATGTSSFTVEVTDGTGATVRRTFSITVARG